MKDNIFLLVVRLLLVMIEYNVRPVLIIIFGRNHINLVKMVFLTLILLDRFPGNLHMHIINNVLIRYLQLLLLSERSKIHLRWIAYLKIHCLHNNKRVSLTDQSSA